MITRDYYRCLGLTCDASPKEIKRAFRRLARKYHPDLNSQDRNANERMKRIIAAYKVLSNPAERERYDKMMDLFGRSQRTSSADWHSRSSNQQNHRQGSYRQNASHRPSPVYIFLLALITVVLLLIFAIDSTPEWRWRGELQIADSGGAYRFLCGLDRPHKPAWEFWFRQREYNLYPCELNRRELVKSFNELAGNCIKMEP